MTRSAASRLTGAPWSWRAPAVGAGFSAQGLGYAAVMTALPSFQLRWRIDETVVSVLVLGTCLAAAAGSVLADVIALRAGSRTAVRVAMLVQAATFVTVAFAPIFPVFVTGIVVYGIGLGLMDAAQNMQGVLVERHRGRPLMGRFYAAYTVASIVGALCMSAFLFSSGAVTGALLVPAAVAVLVAVVAVGRMDPARTAPAVRAVPAADRPRLPGRRITAIGLVVLVVYTLDSAVSTWSTTYLQEGLGVAAAVAPLGYAAYQAIVLFVRLGTDPLEERIGRTRLAVVALVLGIVGCVLVAAIPTAVGAIAGFAVAGVATGALVPLSFGAAGTVLPERSDEVVARVNLFNYGGAVAGAVALGLVAVGPGLGPAFLIPGVALVLSAPLVRGIRPR